ncbi:hypothetical protein OR1_00387 [Geobacter sp. OR-1]|uniref:hypothetical protein n=1 Tax=Geobacter sp. OR-1 TaxID=1266765 RepID=UPI0005440AC2|nr:hypothetical protein [Geobacter sp. OR-1]GAM08116.1 hypothetical protein OR1_00387 [Geobacter sp. OR-1]
MRTINIILGMALLIGGCAFEVDNAVNMDLAPGESTQIKWVSQNRGAPSGDAQLLAAKVLQSGGTSQKSGGLFAWLMSEDPPFAIVAVDEKKSDKDENTVRTLYSFEEETVIAVSYPEFIEQTEEEKDKREQYAREVAIQAKEKRLPLMPLLYEGKYAYSPRYDGSCTVVVTEKNAKYKVTGTFTIDVCRDGN